MEIISLPLWLLIVAVGLPFMYTALLSLAMVRKKRKSARRKTGPLEQPALKGTCSDFSRHVQNQLLEQQIEATFNALVTIVESERVKIKALVGNRLPQQPPETSPDQAHQTSRSADQMNPLVTEKKLATDIVPHNMNPCVDERDTPEELGRRLGLSQTEVDLAMQFQKGFDRIKQHQLTAVA